MPAKALPSPRLPRNEAMRISDLARVPPSERELFCDCACGLVEEIWWREQKTAIAKSSSTLMKVAKAARMLHETQLALSAQDKTRVTNILKREPAVFEQQFQRLPQTTWQLDFIFSTAAGTPAVSENKRSPSNR